MINFLMERGKLTCVRQLKKCLMRVRQKVWQKAEQKDSANCSN